MEKFMYDPEKGKSRRLSLGITVKELADRVGCSTQAVYQWERGERRPSLTTFVVIAHHLRIPIASLVEQAGGDENTARAIQLAEIHRMAKEKNDER
ncbi:helix-turn-helix domain-containing protein [Streptomyces sp. SID685]|nr:helix-turn-helix domain-containing protein [Streptomyces sp. SID685]